MRLLLCQERVNLKHVLCGGNFLTRPPTGTLRHTILNSALLEMQTCERGLDASVRAFPVRRIGTVRRQISGGLPAKYASVSTEDRPTARLGNGCP